MPLEIFLQTDRSIKRYEWSVHKRALEMYQAGYRGEGMKDPSTVLDAIIRAAANPDIERDMSEGMFRFMYVLNQQYELKMAREKLGIPAPEEKPATVTVKEEAL